MKFPWQTPETAEKCIIAHEDGGDRVIATCDEHKDADNEERQKCMAEASYVPWGVMSYEELDAAHKAEEKANSLRTTIDAFSGLSRNILYADLKPAEKTKKLSSLVGDLKSRLGEEEKAFEEAEEFGAFRVLKDKNGDLRWLAIFSNYYKDREDEYLTGKAHEDFVRYVDSTKDFPVLVPWHVLPAEIGKADWIDYADGFAVASGIFTNSKAAENLQGMKDLGCSHGFRFRNFNDGTYHDYQSREITVLPLEYAANGLTAFSVEEQAMPFNAPKKAFLSAVLGDDEADRWENNLGLMKSKAEEMGLSFKDFLKEHMDEVKDEVPAPETKTEPEDEKDVLKSIGALLDSKLEPILTGQKALGDRLTFLEKSDDQKMADLLNPRSQPSTNGHKATKADDNVLGDDDPWVKAAKAAQVTKDEALADVPEHLSADVRSMLAVIGRGAQD